jgi:hypothetical protein
LFQVNVASVNHGTSLRGDTRSLDDSRRATATPAKKSLPESGRFPRDALRPKFDDDDDDDDEFDDARVRKFLKRKPRQDFR